VELQSASVPDSSETRLYHEQMEWMGTWANGAMWRLLQGDALKCLRELPAGSANCVITSPPYFWLRDYGVDGQSGQEDSVAEYVASIANVCDELYRVLADDGVMFLNLGDTYYSGKGVSHGKDPKSKKRRFGLRAVDRSGGLDLKLKPKSIVGIPWRVAFELSSRSWVLRSSIIWHRKHALREAVLDRPRRSHENIFLLAKQRNYYFNRDALKDVVVEEDVWSISARPKMYAGIDTAPYPDELVERCLALGCPPNGTVIDPFAGSGTTLRVSLEHGRSAIGIELNPSFCNHIADQLTSVPKGKKDVSRFRDNSAIIG
jgi:DNA modification methylase